MSTAIVAAHAQRVPLFTYVILKLYYISNTHDVKIQPTMAAIDQCERDAVNLL